MIFRNSRIEKTAFFPARRHCRLAMPLAGLLLPVALAAGCVPANSRVVLAVDRSGSFTQAQRSAWEPLGAELAACVGAGGKLEIFAVSANTMNDGPLFSRSFPVQASRTVAGAEHFADLRKRFRADAGSALHAGFNSADSGATTDLFGILTRVTHDDGPPGLMVLFSDLLNSTPELNLERVALRESDFPALIARLAKVHRWDSRTLAGTKVMVIMPPGARQVGPNNRVILESFYHALFGAMGGTLVRCETHL